MAAPVPVLGRAAESGATYERRIFVMVVVAVVVVESEDLGDLDAPLFTETLKVVNIPFDHHSDQTMSKVAEIGNETQSRVTALHIHQSHSKNTHTLHDTNYCPQGIEVLPFSMISLLVVDNCLDLHV